MKRGICYKLQLKQNRIKEKNSIDLQKEEKGINMIQKNLNQTI